MGGARPEASAAKSTLRILPQSRDNPSLLGTSLSHAEGRGAHTGNKLHVKEEKYRGDSALTQPVKQENLTGDAGVDSVKMHFVNLKTVAKT